MKRCSKRLIFVGFMGAILLSPPFAKAQPTASNGPELTPVGAIKAGNADGTIPAWTEGITEVPAGYETGDFHPDPFPDDIARFTITGQNYTQYQSKLSPGVIELFEAYPTTFKLPVYQTRRTASYPQFVYDAATANGRSARLLAGGLGVSNARITSPFPQPNSGVEAIWNHILRYRTHGIRTYAGQAAPMADGSYTFIGLERQRLSAYAKRGATASELEAEYSLAKFKQKITAPSRLAGDALLIHDALDQAIKPRQAWTYATGRRRVRRTPTLAYDYPGTVAYGLRTADDRDMFNGATDWYDWELNGRIELFIPYNSYKLHSDMLSYDEILKPGHINPDHTRWELHRVWEVEATLKPGFRHIYHKRVFYLDEDTWQIALTEMYNVQGDIFRVGISHALNYYEAQVPWSTLNVFHDLNSRRYIAAGLDNEGRAPELNVSLNDDDFRPDALRREGRR